MTFGYPSVPIVARYEVHMISVEKCPVGRHGQRKEERANRGKHLVHDVQQNETDDARRNPYD